MYIKYIHRHVCTYVYALGQLVLSSEYICHVPTQGGVYLLHVYSDFQFFLGLMPKVHYRPAAKTTGPLQVHSSLLPRLQVHYRFTTGPLQVHYRSTTGPLQVHSGLLPRLLYRSTTGLQPRLLYRSTTGLLLRLQVHYRPTAKATGPLQAYC